MDLDTAIVCVANGEIGISAETKEEAEVIIECAKCVPCATFFEFDDNLSGVPDGWPVFGRGGRVLTWYRDDSPFVASHTIVKASDLLIIPLDSSAVADLL